MTMVVDGGVWVGNRKEEREKDDNALNYLHVFCTWTYLKPKPNVRDNFLSKLKI